MGDTKILQRPELIVVKIVGSYYFSKIQLYVKKTYVKLLITDILHVFVKKDDLWQQEKLKKKRQDLILTHIA